MRELFVIDKKNYIENGTVGKRPSVRGIIIRDNTIAMMHSLKYDYYKLFHHYRHNEFYISLHYYSLLINF